jgi:hypothetical protein
VVAGAIVVAVLTAACDIRRITFDDAVPYPAGCPALHLAADACADLVEGARQRLELPPERIVSIDLLTEDRCGEGRDALCTRSIGFAGGVRFGLAGGGVQWLAMTCAPGATEGYCPH